MQILKIYSKNICENIKKFVTISIELEIKRFIMSKEKADVQKGEIRGAYIGGGIFSILIAIPLIFLFLPFFIHSFTGTFLWDPSQIGINSDMLNYVLTYICYLLPALLFVINLICLFIAKSKSSIFLKLSTLLFILYFVINYSTITISGFVGTDIHAMLSGIPVLGYALVGGGAVCTILGIIFAITDKGHPNRASSFLVFSSIFWLIAAAALLLVPMFVSSVDLNTMYFEPTVLALYGLIGGLFMLFGCHRKIVILPEGARKPKKDVKGVLGQNGDMAQGGAVMQPQENAFAMQQAQGMQQPMEQMSGQAGMPMGQMQPNGAMPQPNMMPQNGAQMLNNPNMSQGVNGMPNAGMPQGQMAPRPPMPGQGMPPQMQRPPFQGMPNGAMPQQGQMPPRPPMQPNGMPQEQMPRPPMPQASNAVPNGGMPPQGQMPPRPPMQNPMGGQPVQPNPNINQNNQNNANGGM